jgi:diacylglycerol kinase (ATP)
MMIILNPAAGGERAMERWEAFCGAIRGRAVDRADIIVTGGPGIEEIVVDALSRGERRFVAAGGDGTVNALVNALMVHRQSAGFRDVAIGAIGLGSSNDFHKSPGDRTSRPPTRLDFGRVRPQDVGCIDAAGPAGPVRRYFIVNASLGVTADGNVVFNRTTGTVAALKRLGGGAAIPAAALLAIARHENLRAGVTIDGAGERPVLLSNLAVLKNPNISGTMRVSAGVSPDDGRIGLWMEEGLSRIGLLRLFINLVAGRFIPGDRSTVRNCASVRVRGSEPFPVEYDGEILHTNDVEFTVLRGAIGVCQ